MTAPAKGSTVLPLCTFRRTLSDSQSRERSASPLRWVPGIAGARAWCVPTSYAPKGVRRSTLVSPAAPPVVVCASRSTTRRGHVARVTPVNSVNCGRGHTRVGAGRRGAQDAKALLP